MPRKPDPDHVRALKGKPPALTPSEQIKFVAERPLPPDFLDSEALVCWDRMAAELEKAGILVSVSRDKLARYCQAWADYSDVIRQRNMRKGQRHIIGYKILRGGGKKRVVIDDQPQLSFWQRVVEQSHKIMSDFESEYGLTPASATKVRRSYGSQTTPGQDLDKFLES